MGVFTMELSVYETQLLDTAVLDYLEWLRTEGEHEKADVLERIRTRFFER